MTSKTDKKKNPLAGVYAFYSIVIALCILAMFVFNLNIYAKAVLCTMVLLCVCIMRSISKAPLIPSESQELPAKAAEADIEEAECIEAETLEEPTEETSTIKEGGAIDIYLSLLLQADAELSSDPNIDPFSPSYNLLLNQRISMMLDAMEKNKNRSQKTNV